MSVSPPRVYSPTLTGGWWRLFMGLTTCLLQQQIQPATNTVHTLNIANIVNTEKTVKTVNTVTTLYTVNTLDPHPSQPD